MGKTKTLHSFFKRKDDEKESKRHKASTSEPVNSEASQPQSNNNEADLNQENQQEKHGNSEALQPHSNTNEVDLNQENQQENYEAPQPQSNTNEVDLNNLERDPAKRKPMWEYPVNLRGQVRRAYLSLGAYQINLTEYQNKGSKKHTRRFQYSWFSRFANWLEYSPTTDASYCFLCYLFSDKPNVSHGYDSFTVKGFDNWKKVNGKNCAFLKHMKSSQHKNSVVFSENLLNQATHIENFMRIESTPRVFVQASPPVHE